MVRRRAVLGASKHEFTNQAVGGDGGGDLQVRVAQITFGKLGSQCKLVTKLEILVLELCTPK